MSQVTISVKGQVVIPAPIRQRLHLHAGSRLEILEIGRQIVLVPVPRDPIASSYGVIKGGKSVSALVSQVREEEEQYMKKKLTKLRRRR